MIRNERERKATAKQITTLTELIEGISRNRDPKDDWYDLKLRAVESQLADLEAELNAYTTLQSGSVTTMFGNGFNELPDLLIKARIARGWTQRDLAHRLGLSEARIQQYEASDYSGASLSRLSEVADALNIEIRETIHLKSVAAAG